RLPGHGGGPQRRRYGRRCRGVPVRQRGAVAPGEGDRAGRSGTAGGTPPDPGGRRVRGGRRGAVPGPPGPRRVDLGPPPAATDGARWQPALSTPPGSPTLWSVVRRPDGTLLACGAVGPVQQPAPGCWTQRGGGTWEPLDVVPNEGTPTPLYLYDLADTGSGPV